jgi:hypothetical protein
MYQCIQCKDEYETEEGIVHHILNEHENSDVSDMDMGYIEID